MSNNKAEVYITTYQHLLKTPALVRNRLDSKFITPDTELYPMLLYNNLPDESLFYTESEHFVVLVKIRSFLNSNFIDEIGSEPCVILIMGEYGGNDILSIVDITPKNNEIEKWNELYDVDTTPDIIIRQQMSQLIDTSDTSEEVSEVLLILIRQDIKSMERPNRRFLEFGNILASKPQHLPPIVIDGVSYTNSDQPKEVKVVKKQKMDGLHSLSIPANDLVTTIEEKNTIPIDPKSFIVGTHSLSPSDAYKISQLDDNFTLFFSIAMGCSNLQLKDLYHSVPSVSTSYGSRIRIELYLKSMYPIATSTFYKTEKQLFDFSEGKQSVSTALGHKNGEMFLCASQLCGLYMRESIYNKPNSGIMTKFNTSSHKKDLNNCLEEMLYQAMSNNEYVL